MHVQYGVTKLTEVLKIMANRYQTVLNAIWKDNHLNNRDFVLEDVVR